MAIRVEDVPVWLILSGIGHAVARENGGWRLTGCGTLTPGGRVTNAKPPRVCRKCRTELATATPIPRSA